MCRITTGLKQVISHLHIIMICFTPSLVFSDEWQCDTLKDQSQWSCQAGEHARRTQVRTVDAPSTNHFSVDQSSIIVPSEYKTFSLIPTRACLAPYAGKTFGSIPKNEFDIAPLFISAEHSEFLEEGLSILAGDVEVKKHERTLRSNVLYIDKPKNLLSTVGGFHYSEPGFAMIGDAATLNTNNQAFKGDELEYRVEQVHARGEAFHANRDVDGIVTLNEATYTTCAPGDNAWLFETDTLILNPDEGYGETYHSKLRIKDIPIAYFPYYSFPIDDRRKSGFLAPTFGRSDDTGTDISVPYYWNIAPNYDATLTPRFMSKRGYQLQTEFRYLSPIHDGELIVEYLPQDKQLDEKRILTQLKHESQFNPHWSANIDYSYVSDDDYFDDLDDNLNLSSLTHLNQEANVAYDSEHISFFSRVQGFQNIDDDLNQNERDDAEPTPNVVVFDKLGEPYDRLPQTSLNLLYPDVMGFDVSLFGEFVNFDRGDSSEFVVRQVEVAPGIFENQTLRERRATDAGLRYDVQPTISYPIEAPYGYIIPKAKLKYTYYHLSKEVDNLVNREGFPNIDRDIDRLVPIYSIDSQLFLERPLTLFGEGFIQTLEPRLFYLYVPERSQDDIPVFDTAVTSLTFANLFRDNRFSGTDRIADAHQISVALTSRLLDNRRNQRIRARVGQTFFFRDREVNLRRGDHLDINDHSSPLFGEVDIAFSSAWRMRGTIEYNYEENGEIDRGAVNFQYLPVRSGPRVFNFGYLFRRDGARLRANNQNIIDDQHQIASSVAWPIIDSVRVLGGITLDLDEGDMLEGFWGLEYHNCCWAVRFVTKQELERKNENDPDREDDITELDTKYFLQVELKGLTGIGRKADNLLKKGIPGYDPDLSLTVHETLL